MRPLICPQCGGQIDEYPAGATFATCEYCSTKFLIESNKAPRAPEPTIPLGPAQPPNLDTGDPTTSFVKILGMVLGAIAVISTIAVVATQNKKPYSSSGPSVGSLFRTPSPTPVPTATPDTSILRFGERGTYDGQFDGASSIAVDKLGRIYVSDNKLRVQQFDEKGNFIKVLQVPAKGRNYDRAHSIDKIEVGTDGKLYVAVGGVILIYTENWAAAPRVVQVAPDYIQDFALKADGSMLAVSDNDRIETLIFVNKSGGITRRIEGFHTDALNAAVSPLETAAEAVRIAVDAKGNIFSVYALGALGSYTLSYNNEDLAIALLTPEAKFIRQFVPTTNVAELLAGPGGLYVSTGEAITLYDADGTADGFFATSERPDAFTVDNAGNFYIIANNSVAKYTPLRKF